MGPTSCVVMSYTINQSKQTATAKYVFDGGTEVPNGEKRVSVVCELIIPTKNGETVIKNKTNGNGEYSRLEKMTKTVALTDAEKAAGYKNTVCRYIYKLHFWYIQTILGSQLHILTFV